jgi:Mg2+ and Co2+ transporter CorA
VCYAYFTAAISKDRPDKMTMEEDIELLREIKDIRDELNMLSGVIDDQTDMIEKLHLRWARSPHASDYERSFEELKTQSKQIKRMDEDAERVEKSVGLTTSNVCAFTDCFS